MAKWHHDGMLTLLDLRKVIRDYEGISHRGHLFMSQCQYLVDYIKIHHFICRLYKNIARINSNSNKKYQSIYFQIFVYFNFWDFKFQVNSSFTNRNQIRIYLNLTVS